MRLPWTKKPETRATDYTDAVITALLNNAAGRGAVDAAQTAAGEFAVQLWGKAFALAMIEGPAATMLPPDVLAMIGRALILRGEIAFDISMGDLGPELLPAASFDIGGPPQPSQWAYNLHLAAPSGQVSVLRMASGVIHIRVNETPSATWRGRSPFTPGGSVCRLRGQPGVAGSQEASARAAMLLPVPDGVSDTNLSSLKTDLSTAAGNVLLVETTAAGMGSGPSSAPREDWVGKRMGATIPAGNIAARDSVGASLVNACGVPAALYVGGDGASIREGWRQFGVNVRAAGRIVGQELSEKLDTAVSLDFQALASIDLAARSRFVQGIVAAGVPLADALMYAGLAE